MHSKIAHAPPTPSRKSGACSAFGALGRANARRPPTVTLDNTKPPQNALPETSSGGRGAGAGFVLGEGEVVERGAVREARERGASSAFFVPLASPTDRGHPHPLNRVSLSVQKG